MHVCMCMWVCMHLCMHTCVGLRLWGFPPLKCFEHDFDSFVRLISKQVRIFVETILKCEIVKISTGIKESHSLLQALEVFIDKSNLLK